MKNTEGQSLISSLFFRGIDRDSDPELLNQDHATLRDVYQMRMLPNKTYARVPGDKELYGVGASRSEGSGYSLRGLALYALKIIEIWDDISGSHPILIYIDGLKVASHTDISGGTSYWVDIAIDEENGDMYITDDNKFPMVLNIADMIDNVATTKYFADFDKDVHRLQLTTQTNQPIYLNHENIGVGGGLKPGSYSYAIRSVDTDGNKTNWSPSTPFIPVTNHLDIDEATPWASMFTAGDESSVNGTRYGIRIRFRVTNEGGYSHIEIKRVANKDGISTNYQPIPEYTVLINNAAGESVDIINNPYGIIDFVDQDGIDWLVLDEQALEESVPIKKAHNIRYYDSRIILGGVKYESRDFSVPVGLILKDSEDQAIQPISLDLGESGYKNPWAQVYRKSFMRGERYGFAFQLVDDFGGLTFATSFPDNKNMKMPGRRDELTGKAYSISARYAGGFDNYGLIDSNTGLSTGNAYEVVSREVRDPAPVEHINVMKQLLLPYNPCGPTGLEGGYGENARNISGWGMETPTNQHDLGVSGALADYDFHNAYKNNIWSLGLGVTGFDVSKLPTWVRGIKIVRTSAAGRVVCQGLGMYQLIPGVSANAATKAANKFWFYSPDIDPDIGINLALFDDIKNNPTDYQIQLVAPFGFTTALFSAWAHSGLTSWCGIDMLSYAAIYNENNIYNNDVQADIAYGDGRVSFGRWRNYQGASGQGTALTNSTNEFIMDISAVSIKHGGEEGSEGPGRGRYFELTIDPPSTDAIYAFTDTLTRTDGDDLDNRRFHEPVYIVNIIKDGKNVNDNNLNAYEDTGTYIKLRSIIGVGTGEIGQEYTLVDERWEDVFPEGIGSVDSSYIRYIEVGGQKWLNVLVETTGNVDTWRGLLESQGYFTVYGETWYGIYSTEVITEHLNLKVTLTIIFPYATSPSNIPIVPGSGERIEVVYNNNSPIVVFGGDTFIGQAYFAPIDIQLPRYGNRDDITSSHFFQLYGPMPGWKHKTNGFYSLPFDASNYEWTPAIPKEVDLDSVRQWVMGFTCESRINLAMNYGNKFPYRHYVQRPISYYLKNEDETYTKYYDAANLWGGAYFDDYGDEYERWGYGGFILPASTNFDYSKHVLSRSYNKPYIGYTEKVDFRRRFVYSLQKNPGIQNSPSLRTFPPTNVYDLKRDDLGEIKLIYDGLSGKGHNLYTITERGIALLLTHKTSLADVTGDMIGMVNIEGKFIQDELWLNTGIGCPDELWRSRAEGVIQLPDNTYVNALSFLNYKGVMLFYGTQVVNIINNWRTELEPVCELLSGSSKISMCFNERWNELWVGMNGKTYAFNFYQNNWTNKLSFSYDLMMYVNDITDLPSTRRLAVLGGDNGLLYYHPPAVNQWLCDSSDTTPRPYVIFVVNPLLHDSMEFIDILV